LWNTLWMLKCISFETAIASASPSASVMVVDIVGALTPNASFSDMCNGAGRRIVPGLCLIISQFEGCVWDVMIIVGNLISKCGNSANNSGVFPELEMKRITSSSSTSPRSPCNASVGWRKVVGIFRELNVATSLVPMCPLPRRC
jgi:hypothetical protein